MNKFQPKNWTKSADQAFDTACKQAREEGKMIAGFKLMYRSSERAWQNRQWHEFARWMVSRIFESTQGANCALFLFFLVREGVILHMASDYQTAVDVNKLNLVGANSHHTMDPQLAAARRNATMFRFTARELPVLQSRENEHKHWLYFLRQTGLRYQYLSLWGSHVQQTWHFCAHGVAVSGCQGYGVIPKTARPVSSDSQGRLWRSNSRFQCSGTTYSWDHVWTSMQDAKSSPTNCWQACGSRRWESSVQQIYCANNAEKAVSTWFC